jgi:Secreted protein acidic and rich in cysteine Ca binding region.
MRGNSRYTCFVPVIQVLERKEWKNFRALVSSKPQLRRCGKRLPRYCDVNNDRKISITEWLNCLSTQRTNTGESCPRNFVIDCYVTYIVLSRKLLLLIKL